MQDAYVAALDAWERDGVPDKPGAWLTAVGAAPALNALRAQRTLRTKLPLLVEPDADDRAAPRTDATRSPTTGCG